MSHIAQYKENMKLVRLQVLDTLQWSEDRFNNFLLDQGREFLQQWLQDDEVVQMIYTSPVFWKWWKNEWHMRDEVFLSYELPPSRLEEIYFYLHSARYLDKKPQRSVMEAMMEQVNREMQKQQQYQNAAVYAVQSIINFKNQSL